MDPQNYQTRLAVTFIFQPVRIKNKYELDKKAASSFLNIT